MGSKEYSQCSLLAQSSSFLRKFEGSVMHREALDKKKERDVHKQQAVRQTGSISSSTSVRLDEEEASQLFRGGQVKVWPKEAHEELSQLLHAWL